VDLYDFLRQFIALDFLHVAAVAVVVGGAAWGIVEAADALVKNRPSNTLHEGINADIKYWATIALCVIIPFLASVLVSQHDASPLGLSGIALAAGVGFTAATTLHWVTSGSQKAAENRKIWKMRKQGKTVPPLPAPPPQQTP
jgi:hypothetical protein